MNSVSGTCGHHFGGTHYVVSQDVDILVRRWCLGMNLSSPDESLYQDLRVRMKTFLESIFAKVTFISGEEIRAGLINSIRERKEAGSRIISLERAYLEDGEVDGRVEITRKVDHSGNDIMIHGARNGSPMKQRQFESLRGRRDLVLVDDVVFSGGTLISTISDLSHYDVTVNSVIVAVGVKAGIDRLKKQTFGVTGMGPLHVDCLEEFDEISDQVCERDFYPGVPYSGREHCSGDGRALPYVLPFGKPGKWASIPKKEAGRFSAMCLDNTIQLFEEIEEKNVTTITCAMLPRFVFGLPRNGTRFVDLLKEKRIELE